ncbi:MAG: LmeA family phospholipid-binding protein [Candidatus Muiribacteriota bacterium]
MKKWSFLILISLIISSNVFGSNLKYAYKEEEFKEKLSTILIQRFFNGEKERVRIEYPELRVYNLITGYLPSIKIYAEDIVLDELYTKYFHIELKNIKLDVENLFTNDKLIVADGMKAKLFAEIEESALNDLMKRKTDKIKVGNPRVRITDDSIFLSGHVKAMFVSSHVEARGRFYIENGNKIHFSSDYIMVAGVKLPQFLLIRVINTINPVLDFDNLGFDIVLNEIITNNGEFIITSFDRNIEWNDL